MYRLLFQDRRSPRPPFVARELMTVIGRDPDCHLQLTENGVSYRHAAIERKVDGYYVRDLGSAVGVRVNGTAVTEQRLSSGDEIELGAVKVRFEFVHDPSTKSRRLDFLQLLATTVIAVTLAGQLGVLGWIVSQPRPRHVREESKKAGRQASPEQVAAPAAIREPVPLVAEPLSQSVGSTTLPATTRSEPEVAALNQMIKIVRVDRVDGADDVKLTIQAKAQVGERELDAAAVAISMQFLRQPATGRAGTWLAPVWLDVGSWGNFTTKRFAIRFAHPPSELTGYVVRSYYRKQLQHVYGAPAMLAATAPEPNL